MTQLLFSKEPENQRRRRIVIELKEGHELTLDDWAFISKLLTRAGMRGNTPDYQVAQVLRIIAHYSKQRSTLIRMTGLPHSTIYRLTNEYLNELNLITERKDKTIHLDVFKLVNIISSDRQITKHIREMAITESQRVRIAELEQELLEAKRTEYGLLFGFLNSIVIWEDEASRWDLFISAVAEIVQYPELLNMPAEISPNLPLPDEIEFEPNDTIEKAIDRIVDSRQNFTFMKDMFRFLISRQAFKVLEALLDEVEYRKTKLPKYWLDNIIDIDN